MATRAFPVLEVPPDIQLCHELRSDFMLACFYEHVWRRMAEGMRESALRTEDYLRREKAGLNPSDSLITMYTHDKSRLEENAIGCDERAQAWCEEAERILKGLRDGNVPVQNTQTN